MKTHDLPEAATALWLADRAAEHGDTVFVVRGVARLERLARMGAGFCAGRVELLVVPPWDVLPYDRVAPTPGVTGRRVQALARLSAPPGALPRLVLLSSGAALQRVPPPASWAGARLAFAVGDSVDREALRAALQQGGYHQGETVADPGDLALHDQVIDIYPAGAEAPARLLLDGSTITTLHRLDPLSQRSLDALDSLAVYPALEFPLDPHEKDAALPLPSGKLVPVFAYVSGFASFVD